MGRDTNAGPGGRGGSSDRSDRGRGGHGRTTSGTVPRKASEARACKDLEGHIFTISSGNKGKDGDMLRASMEKMATYIGTKFGDDAAQEWTSGAQTVIPEPTYSPFILERHAERVKATMDWLNLELTSLRDERVEFVAKMAADPTDRSLKKDLQEIDDDIAIIEI